jgi:hypothetical protein
MRRRLLPTIWMTLLSVGGARNQVLNCFDQFIILMKKKNPKLLVSNLQPFPGIFLIIVFRIYCLHWLKL